MIARPCLSTTRLTLRPTIAEDEVGIARAGRDPDIRELPWFGAGFQDAWAADWVRRAEQEWQAGRNRTFSIIDLGGAYVGSVNLGPEIENALEVAYWILPEQRGKGIATEAVWAVLDWAIDAFPAARIWAKTRLDNVMSQRVLFKCGFHETRRENVVYFDRTISAR